LEDMAALLSPGSEITTLGEKKPSASTGKVRAKHVLGRSLHLEDVSKTKIGTADTVVVRSSAADRSEQKRDGRVLAKTRLVLLARSKEVSVKPLRIVAQIQCEETAEKLQHLVDEAGDSSVTLETIDTAKLSAGAIVQVLWNPELNEVFRDLMDSDGSEITLVDASFFAPPGQKRSFGDILSLGMANKAVPLGILKADGSLSLSPRGRDMVTLDAGDKVVVFADTL